MRSLKNATGPEENATNRRENDCIICMEEDAVMTFIPCGHVKTCQSCKQRIQRILPLFFLQNEIHFGNFFPQVLNWFSCARSAESVFETDCESGSEPGGMHRTGLSQERNQFSHRRNLFKSSGAKIRNFVFRQIEIS
jgi:hypothetical protein